jgi:hypothetical protein
MFWGGSEPEPVKYTQLLKAVRAANPDAFILGGALSKTNVEYLNQLYDAGALGSFDALALHPYVWMDPAPGGDPDDCGYLPMSYKCGVPRIREVMLARGDTRPIWFTEFGWSTQVVGEATQAAHVKRAYELLASWDYVPVAVMYQLLDRGWDTPGFPTNDKECCFGLFRPDARAKLAASAFRDARLP